MYTRFRILRRCQLYVKTLLSHSLKMALWKSRNMSLLWIFNYLLIYLYNKSCVRLYNYIYSIKTQTVWETWAQMGGTKMWSRSCINGMLILEANDSECLILTQNVFQTQGHEHSNEACGSIKSRKYTDQLSNYKGFKK
jgi:hypothetical protein